MNLEGSERAEKSIEFELGLGKAALSLIQRDGAKSCKVSLLRFDWVGLREVETDCDRGSVDCDNNGGTGMIINASKCWRAQKSSLEVLLRS
jgi:hypothetical protein